MNWLSGQKVKEVQKNSPDLGHIRALPLSNPLTLGAAFALDIHTLKLQAFFELFLVLMKPIL